MKQLFLLFSHQLTPQQVADAKATLEVERFVYLPQKLQELWSQVPAELEELGCYLEPLQAYLSQNLKENDMVLIQGDFGATCTMVTYLKAKGYQSYYATTSRKTVEKVVEGKVVKTSVFEHVRFRKY